MVQCRGFREGHVLFFHRVLFFFGWMDKQGGRKTPDMWCIFVVNLLARTTMPLPSNREDSNLFSVQASIKMFLLINLQLCFSEHQFTIGKGIFFSCWTFYFNFFPVISLIYQGKGHAEI